MSANMTQADDMAWCLNEILPDVCIGALRFWGEWFGKPYDNSHQLVACGSAGDVLYLQYNEGELLRVWSPRQLEADKFKFRIADAARIRWQYFAYGRPRIAANLYFWDFKRTDDDIVTRTNVDWYVPHWHPSPAFAAVEIPNREDRAEPGAA